MDVIHQRRRKVDSYCCQCSTIVLVYLVGVLATQDFFLVSGAATKSVKIRPTETTTTTSEATFTTLAAVNGSAVNDTTMPEPRYVSSTASLQNIIRKVNCTEKESKTVRCYHGHCYVIEHPGGRDAPACECLDSYKGPTCKILAPQPSMEDPTKSQTIVGIVVPIVALLVTGVVVYIMCRMKTRRASTCPGGSGSNRHAVILASAENGVGKETKSEDVPLIANNFLPTGVGAAGGST